MKQQLAQYSLIVLALFYLIMLGGGNYEQLNITTLVASAPPKSLYILQGEYGFKPFTFWIIFRPLTILLFIAALILNWNVSPYRRKLIIAAFSIDILVTIATYTYFAPETENILGTTYTDFVDSTLAARATLWKNLNWLRLGGFYLGGILLLTALSKAPNKNP
jgi:hypothetical protein